MKDRIIEELKRGDRLAYELRDVLNIRYKKLWPLLEDLKKEGKIVSYFKETPPSVALAYTLAKRKSDQQTSKYWWQNARTNS